MGAGNGNLGGTAIVEESVYGTTPGSPSWVWQHPVPCSIGPRRPLIQPNLLSLAANSARGYQGLYVDGDYTVGLELDDDIIGLLLGLGGAFTDATTPNEDYYTMGDGSSPDVNSISILESFGGGGATSSNNHEYIHKGIKANELRFDFNPDGVSTLTVVTIGQSTTKTTIGSAQTPNPPAESGVFMPSDLGTVTIGGNTICLYSGSVSVLLPKTGFDRRCMGGVMKEPITAARPDVTFSLACDLDDSTDNDTIDALQTFVTGAGTLGDISIGGAGSGLLLSSCFIDGEFPALQEGRIDLTISGYAESLKVYVGDAGAV